MNITLRLTAMLGAGVIVAAAIPRTAVAVDKLKEVIIRNPAADPVPVAGTVSLGNSAPIPVSGSLTVDNNAPLQVTQAAPEPWQRRMTIEFDGLRSAAGRTFTVPTGKRLTIEFVSLRTELLQEKVVNAQLQVFDSREGHIAHMLDVRQGPGSEQFVSQMVKVYADVGGQVALVVGTQGQPAYGKRLSAAISGTLSDVPAAP